MDSQWLIRGPSHVLENTNENLEVALYMYMCVNKYYYYYYYLFEHNIFEANNIINAH